jgi:hypothetical protein
MTSFNELSKELDELAKIAPNAGKYEKSQQHASKFYKTFIDKLGEVLAYLEATEITNYDWHNHCSGKQFDPTTSNYFRIGDLGKMYNVDNYTKLRCFILIGFDEEEQEEDMPPFIHSFYADDVTRGECSECEFLYPNEWKFALNEFFDLKKAQGDSKIKDKSKQETLL